MSDLLNKGVSLGLGLAATGKEQVEKVVDDLLKKGETCREESTAWTKEMMEKGEQLKQDSCMTVDELVSKGEATKEKIEEIIREQVQSFLTRMHMATKEDMNRLEQRISALEQQLANRGPGTETL